MSRLFNPLFIDENSPLKAGLNDDFPDISVYWFKCRQYKRCLQFFGIKIVKQFFFRGKSINAFVRFDPVVVVDKTFQFRLPMSERTESSFVMPQFHNRSDYALSLAVGSRRLNARKTLFDIVFQAKLHESMALGVSPIFFAVVAVKLLNRIGAFFQNLLQKSLCRVLGFVRKDGRIQLTGEVINGHKEIFPPLQGFLPFQQRQPFCVSMEHLTGIVLVVTFGLFL